MLTYIIKRLLLIIPTILGIVTITFGVLQFVPGGPVEQAISQMKHPNGKPGEAGNSASFGANEKKNKNVTPEQIAELKKLYGFDKPIYIQYLIWVKKMFTFDFGDSYYLNKPVINIIIDKMPVSISLGIISFLLTYLISIPLGMKKARSSGTIFDAVTSIVILLGYSVPGFIIALLLIILFCGGNFFAWFPIRGLTSDNFEHLNFTQQILDYLWHLFLPIIAYMFGAFAVLTQKTRNLFLEELNAQYVTTARAKGLIEKVILFKHVFKNAMIIIISSIPSHALVMFFAGSLLIETIFSLDGIGLLNYESIMRRDYPVVMTMLFIMSLLSLLGQIITDITMAVIDPRITFNKKH